MCHESWVRHRDEAVASRWLRDLAKPTQKSSNADEEVSAPSSEESLAERDEVVAAASMTAR